MSSNVDFELAPRAGVFIAKFDKINGTVELIRPTAEFNSFLVRVNLHEGAGSNQGEERKILHSNITVERVARILCL